MTVRRVASERLHRLAVKLDELLPRPPVEERHRRR